MSEGIQIKFYREETETCSRGYSCLFEFLSIKPRNPVRAPVFRRLKAEYDIECFFRVALARQTCWKRRSEELVFLFLNFEFGRSFALHCHLIEAHYVSDGFSYGLQGKKLSCVLEAPLFPSSCFWTIVVLLSWYQAPETCSVPYLSLS